MFLDGVLVCKKSIFLFIEYYLCVSLRYILLVLLHEEHMLYCESKLFKYHMFILIG